MKTSLKLLTIAGVVALGWAAYSISAADEKPTDASSASRPACCAGKKAAKTAATTEGGAYCQKGAAAATASAGQTPQGQKVTLTGQVLCEHCDLHMAEACAPTLKAEGRAGYLKICPTSKDVPELKKAGKVEVEGYIRPGPDGKEEIEVISFNKKPEKA